LLFNPEEETFIIDRSNSTRIEDINVSDERASHTLFTLRDTNGSERREELAIHVYFDASVLEVFVNGRTAITTRIYPQSGTCYGFRPLAEHSTDISVIEESKLLRFDVYTLSTAVRHV
jgi:beta-fructofuranosidase